MVAAENNGETGTNEITIAEELYRAARAYVDDHGAVRMNTVRVAVGERLHANPELIVSAWNFSVQESVDEGAQIKVEIRQARQSCPKCGPVPRFQETLSRFCPKCSRSVSTEGGQEMQVLEIDFEPEVAALSTDGMRY